MNKFMIGDDVVLYGGDCLEIMRDFADESMDFIFTDPPYGNNNKAGDDFISKREDFFSSGKPDVCRPILNDGSEAFDMICSAFGLFKKLLPKGGVFCCCCCGGGGGSKPLFAKWALAIDEAVGLKQAVVWDKGPIGIGWHYRRSYEFVLVGEKPGAKTKWHDESNAVENIIRPGSGIARIIPSAEQHPTEKPPQLASHFIQLHSLPGETILDPFMGSGSTGEAAINLGRKFIGIELDPVFYEMACKRLEKIHRQKRLF